MRNSGRRLRRVLNSRRHKTRKGGKKHRSAKRKTGRRHKGRQGGKKHRSSKEKLEEEIKEEKVVKSIEKKINWENHLKKERKFPKNLLRKELNQ